MKREARALFEAHVAHELEQLEGESLARRIDSGVSELFGWFEKVSFGELVKPEQISGIVVRYVVELEISPGIKELAGEMTRVVLASRANTAATVGEVVARDSFEDFTTEVLSFGRAWHEVVGRVVRSEALGALVTRVLSHAMVGVAARGASRLSVGPVEGITERLKERLGPVLEQRLRETLEERLGRHREAVAQRLETEMSEALDPEFLRAMVDEIWEGVIGIPMVDVFDTVGEQDLEEFVVLVLEFWLRFRASPYFRQLADEVVAHLYEKYGDESVASLIADMGVTEEIVAAEMREMLIPVVAEAARSGFVERQVRAHLEAFYASPAFAAALKSGQR